MGPLSRRTKWLITGCAPLGAFVLLELGLRVAGYRQPVPIEPLVVWNPHRDAELLAADAAHRVDLDQLWSPRPGAAVWAGSDEVINAGGWRGPMLALEPPSGTVRVALLGESAVYGFSVAGENCCARKLESALAREGVRAEVLNAAVIGFSAAQGLQRYRALVRAYGPHVVFAAFGTANEAAPMQGLPDAEKIRSMQSLKSGWRRAVRVLLTELRVAQPARSLQREADGGEESLRRERRAEEHRLRESRTHGSLHWPGRRRLSLDEFDAALTQLARDVEADGASLILGIMPRMARIEEELPILDVYSERILAVAHREHLVAFDLRAAVRRAAAAGRPAEQFFLPGDPWHLSPAGHAYLAEQLAPLVRQAAGPRPGRREPARPSR